MAESTESSAGSSAGKAIVRQFFRIKWSCYTAQLKYVFWLEENVSHVIGQNFMTP